jgi:hypothetical protein
LPTVARDVLYALARRMQQGNVLIAPQHMPSLTSLARATGWSRRHVQRALNLLELLGILIRRRPTPHAARTKHARTQYYVNPGALQELGTPGPEIARAMVSAGLGTARRQARDAQSRELGSRSPEARDSAAHDQNFPELTDQTDPEIALIIDLLRNRTGVTVTPEWAAGTRELILSRPAGQGLTVRGRIRRVLTLERHPEKWLPTPQPPAFTEINKKETS